MVRGYPPELVSLHKTETYRTATLIIEWENGSGGSFDWSGPYYDDEEDPENRWRYPLLEVNVAEWRIETTATATRHELQLEWPAFLATGLRFHSEAGALRSPGSRLGRAACRLGRLV